MTSRSVSAGGAEVVKIFIFNNKILSRIEYKNIWFKQEHAKESYTIMILKNHVQL